VAIYLHLAITDCSAEIALRLTTWRD